MKTIVFGLTFFSTVLSCAHAASPTFYGDVEPILANRCQSCHRPGEIAPMSFLTYQDARPWAKAIKEAVAGRKMPPWFALPGAHKFANDRTLTPDEVETLETWADNGAPEGNPTLKQPVKKYIEGWNIPEPDLVVEMPTAIDIPASGTMNYKYVIVPLNLKEDRWVQAVEARPSSIQHVHHAVIFVREPGSPLMRGVQPGVPVELPPPTDQKRLTSGDLNTFTIYTPGNIADTWPPGTARLLRAGSDLIFSLHYLPNGKPGRDKTKVGIVFAKGPIKERVISLCASSFDFAIPPGSRNYTVPAQLEIPNDAKLLRFFPHMHLRGSGFEYWLFAPGTRPDLLLRGSRYDFGWQLTYELQQPIELKRGMRVGFVAHLDNSANNPLNPDPSATVRWSELNDGEMVSGFFDIAIDARYTLPEWIAGGPPKSDTIITASNH